MSLSKRKKRKRILPPRTQRMRRSGRLQSAKYWLPKYEGDNVLKGYCKHYGVDWRCAAIELAQLGVKLDPDYLRQREITEQAKIKSRKRRRERQKGTDPKADQSLVNSPYDAWLLEDYALHHELWQEQQRRDANPDNTYDDIPF